MRVVIIGGTSFIGPRVVRRLISLGHEVALFHRGQSRAELAPEVEHVIGDRHDLRSHRSDFTRLAPEVVVDMIAFTEADALGLVETFRGLARKAVVISSADVYRAYGRFLGIEPGPIEPTPLTAESPLRTVLYPYRSQARGQNDFFYSYDKIPVENVIMNEPDLPAAVLRLPMVHGPGDPYKRLWQYLKRMDDRRPVIVLDEVMARWTCPRGYVDDVAAAIALAVVDERSAGRVYNVAEPVACSEAEWVGRIGDVAGWAGQVVPVPRGRIPSPYGFEQSLSIDSGRIRRELGFAESVSARDALQRTVSWERANPPASPQGVGLLDYDAEDALLVDIGHDCSGLSR